MKFFDLHNDAVVDLGSREKFVTYNNGLDCDVKVIFAIWSTRLTIETFEVCRQILFENKVDYAVEDCDLISDTPKILEINKPKYCSLTWNYDNSLAGGSTGRGTLTNKGIRFIDCLNEMEIPIDLSHIGLDSFEAVLMRSDKILISHCGIEIGADLPRTPTFKQVEGVIKRGGIIGATFVPQFYSRPTIDGFVKNVVDFVRRFGDENLAIGTDFYGCNPIEGLIDYDSITVIAEKLHGLGLMDDTIDKIFYSNASNFFYKAK